MIVLEIWGSYCFVSSSNEACSFRFSETIKLEQKLVALLEARNINEAEISSIIEQARSRLAEELQRADLEVTQTDSHTTAVQEQDPVFQSMTDGDSAPSQCNKIKDSFLVQYSVGWVCARTLSQCVDAMEKLRHYDRACDLSSCLTRKCSVVLGEDTGGILITTSTRGTKCVCVCVCAWISLPPTIPPLIPSSLSLSVPFLLPSTSVLRSYRKLCLTLIFMRVGDCC